MNEIKLLLGLFLVSLTTGFAQGEKVEFDTPPEPIGGYAAIQRAVEYPEEAFSKGIEGTVIVQCTIDTMGIVIDTKILKGPPIFHEAAINAMEKLKWIPSMQGEKPVQVSISLPVIFRVPKGHSEPMYWPAENSDSPKKEPRKFDSSEKYKLIGTLALLGIAYFIFK